MNQPEISQFTASDGYRFHYRRWSPPSGTPRGYVVALHGIQSHSGWYEYSSRVLCEAGYEVCFLDRRGSGLNQALRGHAPHEERLIHDVVQFLADVRYRRDQKAPQAPVVLMGVSWGGKLAAVTCAHHPHLVDALALLYPGLCPRIRPKLGQKFQLKTAEKLGIRREVAPIPLNDPRLFTGEREWQDFIRNDPLALHEVTVSFLLANRELDRITGESPEKIGCPVLLMLAGRDQIIDNAATRSYLDRMISSRRKVIEYSEAQHTLEFEPNRDEIFDDLKTWLDSVKDVHEKKVLPGKRASSDNGQESLQDSITPFGRFLA